MKYPFFVSSLLFLIDSLVSLAINVIWPGGPPYASLFSNIIYLIAVIALVAFVYGVAKKKWE
jgi:hypothetical protein